MRDSDLSAFRLLLDRYDFAVQDRVNRHNESADRYRALCEARRRNAEYADLVQELDKALNAAKVKKRPKLPEWHAEKFQRDDILF